MEWRSAGRKPPAVEHNHGSGGGNADPASGCCTTLALKKEAKAKKTKQPPASVAKNDQFVARKGKKSASSIVTHAAKNFGIHQQGQL